MKIIIGLGTGRSGSQSLSKLINDQSNTVCFHELNPSSMRWSKTPRTVLSMIYEFQSVLSSDQRDLSVDYSSPEHCELEVEKLRTLQTVTTIGDVAFYYLSYIPLLADLDIDIRMPCIRRDRQETVESFIEKCRIKRTKREHIAYYLSSLITGKPRHQYRNHWIRHQGEKWQPDFNWDKLFPNVESGTLKSALLQYWDNYYAKAEEYEKIYPKNFRIFEIDALNSSFGQQEILEFCGLKEHTNFKEFHVNKST